jgi:hypothetical protein
VFGPGNGQVAAQPGVDVKSLHAKIGELTLENDFLEGALTKAVLLSASSICNVTTIAEQPLGELRICASCTDFEPQENAQNCLR